ncbi:MAG: DUF357 domain-containing protein [Candidatus Thalassarchaeaceae archaeon]
MENALLTVEKIERYLLITSKARTKATPITVNKDEEKKLSIMLRMCDDYTSDARHFLDSGNLIDAFGAINYAHAWIDAAVKIGFLDGHDDDILFTLP